MSCDCDAPPAVLKQHDAAALCGMGRDTFIWFRDTHGLPYLPARTRGGSEFYSRKALLAAIDEHIGGQRPTNVTSLRSA